VSDAIARTQEELAALNIPRFPPCPSKIEEEWRSNELRKDVSRLKKDASFMEEKKKLESQTAAATPPSFLYLFWCWLRWHFIGCFITGVALSLGAPFWFDLLNKLVNLRSAGKKPEPGTEPAKV
jgi:hypothetical protein